MKKKVLAVLAAAALAVSLAGCGDSGEESGGGGICRGKWRRRADPYGVGMG